MSKPKKLKPDCEPFINTTVIDNEIGTTEEPYLTNITTGTKTGNSAIFHTEEHGKHFEYFRHHVTSTGLSARCIYFNKPGVNCRASRTFTSEDPSIIKCERRPKRNLYFLKTDEESNAVFLDRHNWKPKKRQKRSAITLFA